jgi:carbonic anhydrase
VPVAQALPAERRTVPAVTAANAAAQAKNIAGADPIIKAAVQADDLMVVAAVYNIANGRVSLL